MSFRPVRFLALALAFAVAAPTALTAQEAAPGTPPPTYTDSQAVRGQQWFEASCQACHPTRDMSSADFKVRWGGLMARDLYEIISNTMPQLEPGSLSRRTYVDIVAYLMQLNGIPAGSAPLTTDSTRLATTRLHFGAPTSAPR
jgi:mono/diheme cytochrome c family protein